MEYCGRRTPRSRAGPHAGRRRGSTSTHYINDSAGTLSAATCMDNLAIARVLAEIGDLLEIKDENPFKIRAYRNAAETIAHHPDRVAALPQPNGSRFRGSARISPRRSASLSIRARSPYHQELLQEFPPTILDLLHLQGVGPKTVALLYHQLGIRTLDDLKPRPATGACGSSRAWAQKGSQSSKALEERTGACRDTAPSRRPTRLAASSAGSRTRPGPSSTRSAACGAAARRAATSISSQPARRRR